MNATRAKKDYNTPLERSRRMMRRSAIGYATLHERIHKSRGQASAHLCHGCGVAPAAEFMVSYLHQEEKGSDVNVAAHLLIDVLKGDVDAAVVISNDSDLRFAIQYARTIVPVGTVAPAGGRHAGALCGQPNDGVGNHWWRRLRAQDIRSNQLPDPAGKYTKPVGW